MEQQQLEESAQECGGRRGGGEMKKKKSRAKYSSYFFGHHSDGCCCFYGGTVCSGRQLPQTHLVSRHREINAAIRKRLNSARIDFVFLFFSVLLFLLDNKQKLPTINPSASRLHLSSAAVPAEEGGAFLRWRHSAQALFSFSLLLLFCR